MDEDDKTEPQTAKEFIERGTARFKAEDFDGAIADFTEAIRLKPDYAKAYYNRAVIQRRRGDLDGAIADYTQAIELKPDYADAYYNRGVDKVHRDDLDGAVEDFTQAIKFKPDFADAYYNRGVTKMHRDDLDGAIEDFTQAIELKPDSAEAYNNRGVAKAGKEDLEGAIADYDEAIRLNPDYARAYNNRGVAKAGREDLEGAIADYDEAIRLNPDYAKAYNNRGVAKAGREDLEGAIADYDEAIRLNPDYAKAYNNRALAKSQRSNLAGALKGDLAGAFEDFCQVIKLDDAIREERISDLSYRPFFIFWFAGECQKAGLQKEQGKELWPIIEPVFEAVGTILRDRLCRPADLSDGGVVHYTSLHVLRSLLGLEGEKPNFSDKKSFRLYDAHRTNDPSEGKLLLKALGESLCDTFMSDSETDTPVICLGSFVGRDEEDKEEGINKVDSLTLWRFYGKTDGREATGCSLFYPAECFSENLLGDAMSGYMMNRPTLADSPRPSSDSSGDEQISSPSDSSEAESQPPKKLPLFKVFYLPTSSDKSVQSPEIQSLKEALQTVKEEMNALLDEQELICKAVRVLLDSVRFLFKSNQYGDEGEMRIIQPILPEDDAIDLKVKNGAPCYYTELKGFEPSRIMIAPHADKGWVSFLKTYLAKSKSKIKVERSKIDFDPN